jgi:hypothetical protein
MKDEHNTSMENFIINLKRYDYNPLFQLDIVCLRINYYKKLIKLQPEDRKEIVSIFQMLNNLFAHIHSGNQVSNYKNS